MSEADQHDKPVQYVASDGAPCKGGIGMIGRSPSFRLEGFGRTTASWHSPNSRTFVTENWPSVTFFGFSTWQIPDRAVLHAHGDDSYTAQSSAVRRSVWAGLHSAPHAHTSRPRALVFGSALSRSYGGGHRGFLVSEVKMISKSNKTG